MVEELKYHAMNYLYDETNYISMIFAAIERQTYVPREGLASLFGCLFSLYLIFGYFAQLVCNFVGFAYPAYESMDALETENKEDDTQWLTYWTVYAVFSMVDFAAADFPMYWFCKCVFLIYLYHPKTMGAKHLYESHVRGLLQSFKGLVTEMKQSFGFFGPGQAAQAPPPPPPPLQQPPFADQYYYKPAAS